MQKFSVLMSIYYKEKPEYARECFESLLGQTVLASEWVIVEDGPLTDGLYAVLDEYQAKYPELLKRVPLAQNVGLGMALREGILHCSNEIVARMDTDDIARYDRFEKQLEMFEKDPTLDICSSHVKEFIGKYKEDGFIWFLEACELNVMSIRRAIWQLKHAGWFEHVKGFLIGRPLCFGEEMFGIDQYRAVTDLLKEYEVPIVMDMDIGHLAPMMPMVCGATAKVISENNNVTVQYTWK